MQGETQLWVSLRMIESTFLIYLPHLTCNVTNNGKIPHIQNIYLKKINEKQANFITHIQCT